jgi:4a-hydroxytetrahydrobiopterin dehydratase
MAEFLQLEPQWTLQNGELVREWTFTDFVAAMGFVTRVAELAEARGHHPDIDIRYNLVRLGLVTHDASGVTERDLQMAREVGGLELA